MILYKKNESPFETWKLEVECMKKNAVYPDFVVTQVIRNSFKGHARNVLFTISSTATSQEIIDKLEGIFGDVACRESIMQDFYTATQNESESVMLWGLRLEEIIQRGIEKGHIDASQKNDMLRTRFWRALFSTELKNATRLHYVQCQDFETLRKKVSEEEYEMFKVKTMKVSESTGRTNVKQDIQHQPLNLAGTRDKDVKDISRRLDAIEKC